MGANGATGEVSAERLPDGETFEEFLLRLYASTLMSGEGVTEQPFEADMLARVQRYPAEAPRIVLVSTPGGAFYPWAARDE